MNYLQIIITSSVSLFALFLLTKLIGNREIAELSMFDYLNGITIGSIAAEMSISKGEEVIDCLIAMIVYSVLIFIISILTNKSIIFNRFINGKSLILFDNNTFYRKNFAKSKINLAEFQNQCRTKGFFDMSQIKTAIIEANGKITILPKSDSRPVTCSDLNLNVDDEKKQFNIIIDGKILYDNLKATGNNEKWLIKKLQEQNLKLEDIFLATFDFENNVSAYKKSEENIKHDAFI